MKPGGSDGGTKLFFGGIVLLIVGLYLFLDSVQVVSGQYGWFSGMIGGNRQGFETGSMGIVFVPFIIGVGGLFYSVRSRWAWFLSGAGLLVILIEILSRLRFVMNIKTSHLMIMLVMMAAGVGLMARGLLSDDAKKNVKRDE